MALSIDNRPGMEAWPTATQNKMMPWRGNITLAKVLRQFLGPNMKPSQGFMGIVAAKDYSRPGSHARVAVAWEPPLLKKCGGPSMHPKLRIGLLPINPLIKQLTQIATAMLLC